MQQQPTSYKPREVKEYNYWIFWAIVIGGLLLLLS